MGEITHILEGANVAIPDYTVGSFLLSLILSFVLGQLIAWAYAWTHSGLSYSRSFTQSLVLMTMLVGFVMFVIGNSIVAAFGLLGALAIIRFRNVLKDTRDTTFVFLSLVIGMACGTQRYSTAIMGAIALLAVTGYLSWTGFGTFARFDGYLSVRLAWAAGDDFSGVVGRFCRATKQVSKQQGGMGEEVEYIFEVDLRDRGRSDDFVAALRSVAGVVDASLVLRDELAEI